MKTSTLHLANKSSSCLASTNRDIWRQTQPTNSSSTLSRTRDRRLTASQVTQTPPRWNSFNSNSRSSSISTTWAKFMLTTSWNQTSIRPSWTTCSCTPQTATRPTSARFHPPSSTLFTTGHTAVTASVSRSFSWNTSRCSFNCTTLN